MYTIHANPARRRLSVVIRHVYDAEDLKSILFQLEGQIPGMGEAWTAALDLRGMQVLPQKYLPYLKRLQWLLVDGGAVRIAVLLDNIVLKMQFQRISWETGCGEILSQFTEEQPWKFFLAAPPTVKRPGDRDRDR